MNRIVFCFALLYSSVSLSSLSGTTIRPYPHLGEMARATSIVVLAKATSNYTVLQADVTRFRTAFEVREIVTGQIEAQFDIQSHRMIVGQLQRMVFGEATYEEGETYLLFLEAHEDYYRPTMLSHGIFQLYTVRDEEVLAPIADPLNFHIVERSDGRSVEPFYVFKKQSLLTLLRDYVSKEVAWNSTVARSNIPLEQSPHRRGTPPSHCTFLGSPEPYPRWTNFESQGLPVRMHVAGDPQCSSVSSVINDAIASMNIEYQGIYLDRGSDHTFVPTCSGEGSTDQEYLSFFSSRVLGIQFDDPCNEITDLSGCNGTLAFGGLWWGGTHTYDGMSWNNAAYGYVVINNGVGNCLCSSNGYEYLMTHEMSHSLGIGHISGSGTANMNPVNAGPITNLDVECLNFSYMPAGLLPVELLHFGARPIDHTVHLDWQTASEFDSDHFVLERSVDGLTFDPIATLTAAGYTEDLSSYQYLDRFPWVGVNYYRLLEVDLDGNEHIHATVTARVEGEFDVFVSPNPVDRDLLSVRWRGASAPVCIDLVSLIGGFPTFRLESDAMNGGDRWDVSHVPPGAYILHARAGDMRLSRKVLRLRSR